MLLSLKDEQLRVLNEQNAQLLHNLSLIEEDSTAALAQKGALETENECLRDERHALECRVNAADNTLVRIRSECHEKNKQLHILSSQNSELLRLLEAEESHSSLLAASNERLRKEMEELKSKHAELVSTAKAHHLMATRAAEESQLRSGEARMLHDEVEVLTTRNSEFKLKSDVEVESLQEQLRAHKLRQYDLLGKLQAKEVERQGALEQVSGLEQRLRLLQANHLDLESQLQVETNARQSRESFIHKLTTENINFDRRITELQQHALRTECDKCRVETEARDSTEHLREMAHKVFQLLERLKLTELGRSQSMAELERKESEILSVLGRNTRLLQESTKEGRARVKAELNNRLLQDEIRALKAHNCTLARRCRQEVKLKLAAYTEKHDVLERSKAMAGRLGFLLNKTQADEAAQAARDDQQRNQETRFQASKSALALLRKRVNELTTSNGMLSQALTAQRPDDQAVATSEGCIQRQKPQMKFTHVELHTSPSPVATRNPRILTSTSQDTHCVRMYFQKDARLYLLKGLSTCASNWLHKHEVNQFLRGTQAGTSPVQALIHHIAWCHSLLVHTEQELAKCTSACLLANHQQTSAVETAKCLRLELNTVHDAKQRILLRYVDEVQREGSCRGRREDYVANGASIQLPISAICDDDIHAISALIRVNPRLTRLSLYGNSVTDDGAHVLASVLSDSTSIVNVDLRKNKLSRRGVQAFVDALTRNPRVSHVYVHNSGRVEAVGTSLRNPLPPQPALPPMPTTDAVPTICAVDCRDNVATGTARTATVIVQESK